MVRIRHEKGGQGIGPYWWPREDPVCEVDEALARDLLANPWGYSLEPDPEPEPEPAGAGEEADGEPEPPALEADGEDQEKAPAKASARRSRAKGATA